MNCEWSEKVSALIDGELDASETRAVERHVETCAACRRARDGFLLLRRQLNSYGAITDSFKQRKVLTAVLSSKAGAARGGDRRERGWGLFGLPRLAPAMSAALALILVAAALGLFALMRSRKDASEVDVAGHERAPAREVENSVAVINKSNPEPGATPSPENVERKENESGGGAERRERRDGIAARKTANAERQPKRTRRPRTKLAPVPDDVATRTRPEENNARDLQPNATSDPSASTPAATNAASNTSRGVALDTARHAEQAQMLLRAFRNARLADDDLAYERARSKKLLYRNIVLRREAAAKRDITAARALGRLEPLLLDIANLPDKPAEEDVNSIRERMRKQNIVVLLQASAATRGKSY